MATALATWTVLGGTSLGREAQALGRALEDGDLAAARRRLPALCGRDPDQLDPAGVARAAVESVAENTSDAVVAPLLWGAVFGLPGLLGYRAVNTLDAMIGHHSPRYERFGWAAARLDDAANLIPARVTGLLPLGSRRPSVAAPRQALASCAATAASIPSPNAGRVRGSLRRVTGRPAGRPERLPGPDRAARVAGRRRPPQAADIARAVRLSRLVSAAAVVLAALSRALCRAVEIMQRSPRKQ